MSRALVLSGLLVVAGCATAPPAEGPPPPALSVDAVDEPPRLVDGLQGLLARIRPTNIAPGSRRTGEVVVAAVVDAEGRVIWAGIERSAGRTLDHAVLDAVRASSFVPAVLDGEAVQARVEIPVSFSFERQRRQ